MDFKFVLRLLEANQFENEVVEYKKNNKDFIVLGKIFLLCQIQLLYWV